MAQNVLLCLGWGFSARHVARRIASPHWMIRATARRPVTKLPRPVAKPTTHHGTHPVRDQPSTQPHHPNPIRFFPFTNAHKPNYKIWQGVTHLLVSIPPTSRGCRLGDSGLNHARYALKHCSSLRWIGYLSSTGVYGDHGGALVDERTPTRPALIRSLHRQRSEQAWIAACAPHRRLTLHVFRLAGIYGVGRSAIDNARQGTARRIHLAGHVFSRIHAEDIAAIIEKSMQRAQQGQAYRRRIYNVCDDHPAPGHAVVSFACALLGVPEPPLLSLKQANLRPMARSFYQDRRRVDNHRAKRELNWHPHYPDYRAGLRAIALA